MSGEPRAVIEGAVSLETDHLAMSQDGSDPSVAHGGQHRVTSSQHQAAGVAMHEQVPEIGHPTDSFLDRAGSSEPAGAIANDSLNHVAVPDSPEFSPEPADGPTSDAAGHLAAQAGELAAPATISDVPRSRDDTQEIEGPVKSEVQARFAQCPFQTDHVTAQPRRCSPQASHELRTLRKPPPLLPGFQVPPRVQQGCPRRSQVTDLQQQD